MRAGGVGLIFAGTRNRKLDQHGGNWSQNEHEKSTDAAAAAFVPVASAKEQSEARQKRDSASNCGCDRADQNVAVTHMAKLMGQDAGEFFIVEQIEDALGYGNRRVRRISSSSKCIR